MFAKFRSRFLRTFTSFYINHFQKNFQKWKFSKLIKYELEVKVRGSQINSKSPQTSRVVRGGPRKVGQNTFKNKPEDDLDTFCDIISHMSSKYRLDFLGTSKIAGPNRTGLRRILCKDSKMVIFSANFVLITSFRILVLNFSFIGAWLNLERAYHDP